MTNIRIFATTWPPPISCPSPLQWAWILCLHQTDLLKIQAKADVLLTSCEKHAVKKKKKKGNILGTLIPVLIPVPAQNVIKL